MIHVDILLIFLVLLISCKKRTCAEVFPSLSTPYRSRVIHTYLFAWFTTSTTLWASLSCSSIPLEKFGINTGDKFSSLPKSSAAMTKWFLSCMDWLKCAFPNLSVLRIGNLSCHPTWKFWVLQPSNWNQFWTKKIVQSCLCKCQSPHSRCKLTRPTRKWFCNPWVIEIKRW